MNGNSNIKLFQTADAASSPKDPNERQKVEGFIAATSFQTCKLKERI